MVHAPAGAVTLELVRLAGAAKLVIFGVGAVYPTIAGMLLGHVEAVGTHHMVI